jgi:predicted dehydrogenase
VFYAAWYSVSYTAGVIGLSWVGRWHRDALESVDAVDVVAIADVDDDALETCGVEWDVAPERRYKEHTDFLAEETLDVVTVATPTFLHNQHVLDAARSAALPNVIWVEKPIAGSVTEADEMIEACSDADVELVVNHARRFGDAYRAFRAMVQSGDLGSIRSIHLSAPEELLRNGTHYVDLVNYLLDDPFEWVFGFLTGESEEMGPEFDDSGGAAMLRTASGTYVHVDCTVPRGMHDGTWTIVGTEGKLLVNAAEESCRFWRLEDDEDAPYGRRYVEANLPRKVGDVSDVRSFFDGGAEHVVDLLEGTAENLSPGEDAAHVLEALVAAFVSHYTKTAIDVPLERPLRDVTITSH